LSGSTGGPVPNAQHDLGTDLFVQARDARRFDLGLVVGVQVKAGPSYFADPDLAEDGSLRGWWYYEPQVDHFNAWVTHGLPHLLVLRNLETRTSYWVHVTAKAVQSTGQGAKILVPVNQTIDPEHLDALLAVEASHKPVIGLEGTAWAASASNVAPPVACGMRCWCRAWSCRTATPGSGPRSARSRRSRCWPKAGSAT
jgi:hypothetical protein